MKLIVGYHGKRNFGDDLILNEYINLYKNEKMILFSYGRRNNDYFLSPNIEVKYWTKHKIINAIKFIITLIKCNNVVWVGGTCFSDQDGIGGYNYMSLALRLGRTISYQYVGINRLKIKNNRKKAFYLLSRAESIILRDCESKNNLDDILNFEKKCIIKSDLGDIYLRRKREDILSQVKAKESKVVLIAWRELKNYLSYSECEGLINSMCNYIIKNQDEFDCFYIFNTDETLDLDVSNSIYKRLKYSLSDASKVKIYNDIDNLHKIEIIAASDLIITARLHIAIAGSIFDINTLVLNYSEKIENLSKYYNYTVFDKEFFKDE